MDADTAAWVDMAQFSEVAIARARKYAGETALINESGSDLQIGCLAELDGIAKLRTFVDRLIVEVETQRPLRDEELNGLAGLHDLLQQYEGLYQRLLAEQSVDTLKSHEWIQ
jgi:hypothetical protein